jgi:HSP20 family molecular chaperone IbpA
LNTDLVKRLDSLMLSIAGMDENELKVSIEGRTVTGTTEVTVRVRG